MKKVFVVVFVCILALAAISGASAMYPETQKNLMAAVTGETQANANYRAFADAAEKEGHKEIGAIFKAISEAELKHASDEFAIAQTLSSVEKPVPGVPTPGTTAENLQAAINGETEEYTVMYPGFIKLAQDENMLDARGIFTLAKLAEEVHAGIYTDLLKGLNEGKFNGERFAKIYRCPVCGNIVTTVRPLACPICGDEGADLIEYEIVK